MHDELNLLQEISAGEYNVIKTQRELKRLSFDISKIDSQIKQITEDDSNKQKVQLNNLTNSRKELVDERNTKTNFLRNVNLRIKEYNERQLYLENRTDEIEKEIHNVITKLDKAENDLLIVGKKMRDARMARGSEIKTKQMKKADKNKTASDLNEHDKNYQDHIDKLNTL